MLCNVVMPNVFTVTHTNNKKLKKLPMHYTMALIVFKLKVTI